MNGNAGALIVADIGGTNGRFALAKPEGGNWRLERVEVFASTELADLAALLSRYLETLDDAIPARACLAIAGPVDDNRGHLTNLGWSADGAQLQAACGLEDVQLVNDFAALAMAAPYLAAQQLHPVAAGTGRRGRPLSVLGPGTGLGVTLLVPQGEGWLVLPTEGGHVGFAPATDLEQELLGYLQRSVPHVSAEYVLCGQGLVRIHEFLRQHQGLAPRDLQPPDISAAALQRSDPVCVQTVDLFLAMLGSFAGDVALIHGAAGGVFLGGGVLQKIVPLLDGSALHRRFLAKGPMRSFLADVPIRLITAGDAALLGAARLYRKA